MQDSTIDAQAEQQDAEQPEVVQEEASALAEAAPAEMTTEEAAPPSGAEAAASSEKVVPEKTADEMAPAEMTTEEAAPLSGAEAAASSEEVVPEKTADEMAPAGPSFAQRFGTSMAGLRQRLGATLAPIAQKLGPGARSYGVYVLIGVLILAALLLPPISLLERLGVTGYTSLNAENPTVSHPDGIQLGVDPESFADRLRVQLDAIPQLEFLEGSAGSALRRAVEPEQLPAYLEIKSPFYQIEARGRTEDPVMIDVMIPNNAEPWETLDLYTWTGESWEWVGSELHDETAESEFIRARTTDLPSNVVVMQTRQSASAISVYMEEGDDLMTAGGVAHEVNPIGLMLGPDGALIGTVDSLPQPIAGASFTIVPTLRNWTAGDPIASGPISDVLSIPEIQEVHIAGITQLCVERGFAGVDVDYRGLTSADREAYSAFIAALADALHAEGLKLSVVVASPTLTATGWDTGGYDWLALGSAADAIKVPFPADPSAYDNSGQAQQLIEWAKSQVPRQKLHMLVSSLSAQQSSDDIHAISLEQALAPLGSAVAIYGVTAIEPGSPVEFSLSATQLHSIAFLETAGTYRLEYGDETGNHIIWLGTSASLANKLHWAQQYRLGGVAVVDLLDPGNAAGIVETLASYRTAVTASGGQDLNVTWTVANAETLVDQYVATLNSPDYTWTAAADSSGSYSVSARIAGFDHGSVAISVVAAQPEEPEAPPTQPAVGGGGEGEAVDECLNASYVADVTVPDNTQFDNDEAFVKTWRVRNSGTCAWPEGSAIAFASGAQMGAPDSVALEDVVESGEEVEISVEMKAPTDAGVYTGIWRMQSPQGFFGGNLSVVIRAGEVTAAAAPVYAPVSGGAFELGGHIQDEGYPYADKMHYAGMTWAKLQARYDPNNNFAGPIASAHTRGFKIQLSALGSPDMVTQPGFEQNFANWVASMAAAGADAIEIWNEPNIDREWLNGAIDPAAYTRLLCASYQAIKAANPSTLVISAAPAPTGYFGGCYGHGCDDLPWLQGMYNAGAGACMDYIGAHHNAGATSPSASEGHPADDGRHHHSWYFLPQTQLYFNTFGGTKKLFYTEMGYVSPVGYGPIPDSFAWGGNTTVEQQAAWLAEAVQLSINTGMVRCIIVWNVDYRCYGLCGGVPDPQGGYAITRPDGSCPACDTLHNLLGTR